MIRYCLLAGTLGIALYAGAQSVSATEPVKQSGSRPVVSNVTPQDREAIRQTPLLERPNRPGHFYGNTVRWLHDRRASRGG